MTGIPSCTGRVDGAAARLRRPERGGRVPGRGRDLRDGVAELGAHGGGDRALDQRRVGEDHPVVVRHLQHGLDGHRRGAEVGEDHDSPAGGRVVPARGAQRLRDRALDAVVGGAERPVVRPAGRHQRDVGGHLAGDLDDPAGQQIGVGDDD